MSFDHEWAAQDWASSFSDENEDVNHLHEVVRIILRRAEGSHKTRMAGVICHGAFLHLQRAPMFAARTIAIAEIAVECSQVICQEAGKTALEQLIVNVFGPLTPRAKEILEKTAIKA